MTQDRGRKYVRPLDVRIGEKQRVAKAEASSVVSFYTESPSQDGTIAIFVAPVSGRVSKVKIYVENMNVDTLVAGAYMSHIDSKITIEGRVELKAGVSSLDEPFNMTEGSVLKVKINDYNRMAVEIEHIAVSVIFKGGR